MTIHIANLTINQSSNGLYSINDIHRASGGLAKHQPAAWMRLQATTNLIRLMESQVINQQSKNSIVETIEGRNYGGNSGTFVCRKLVVAYALWISTEFFSHVLDVFLDVVDGVYARVAEQDRIIEEKTLQLDLFTGELASMRKRDPRGKNTLPVLTGTEAHQAKPLFDKLEADGYVIKREYMPTRTQYIPTDKAYDDGLIIEVKNRTIHFTSKVLEVLGMEVQS